MAPQTDYEIMSTVGALFKEIPFGMCVWGGGVCVSSKNTPIHRYISTIMLHRPVIRWSMQLKPGCPVLDPQENSPLKIISRSMHAPLVSARLHPWFHPDLLNSSGAYPSTTIKFCTSPSREKKCFSSKVGTRFL